jgi:glutathione S-transferase
MKIYDWHFAPNPRRVRLFLAEKGIDVPLEEVGTPAFGLKPEYLAAHPEHAMVPMLELDDGTCIGEAMAICRYFEELHPEPPLMGVDAKDKAIVEMWERKATEGMLSMSEVLRNVEKGFVDRSLPGYPGQVLKQIPELVERGNARLEKFHRVFDAALAKNRFITGDRFTVADVTAFCLVDFLPVVGMPVPAEFRNLHRWHADVAERPSARKTR